MAKKTKTIVVKDVNELVAAVGKDLAGYKIANKVDTTKFVYPVTLTLDTEAKTYTAVDSSAKAESKTETKVEVSTSSESKKSKIIKYVVWGFIAVVVVAIVVFAIVK